MKKLFLFTILLLFTLGFTSNASAIYLVPGDQSVTANDVATAEKAVAGLQWDVSRAVYDNKVKLYLPKFDGYSWTVRKDTGDYIGIGLYWEQVYDGEGNVTLEMNITNAKGVGFYVLFSKNSTATVIAEEEYIFYPNMGVNYIPPEDRITVSIDENGNITRYYDVTNKIIDSNAPKVVNNMKNNPTGNHSNISSGSSNNSTDVISKEIKFSDLTTSHWSYQVISELTSQGFIKGYPDGTFRPDGNITRAEFSAIISTLTKDKWPDGAKYNNEKIFPDINSSHWAFGVANRLMGYMTKDDAYTVFGQKFQPDKKITREEVAATLYFVLKSHDKFNSLGNQKSTFTDINKTKFADGISFCVSQGFIKGYPDGTFRPGGNITRAEIAAILVKVVNALK